MSRAKGTAVKFTIFGLVMALLTASLFVTFSQYRAGSTNSYSAVFTNVSRLKSGDTVRVAGIRVGTVQDVSLRPDNSVLVDFDTDRNIVLTTSSTVAVRYLNLVGDRYLELSDGPGPAQVLSAGAQLPVERTTPALDLDLLLGGLRPLIRGLNPQDVNALTGALLQILQGQDGSIESLFSRTSSFANTLADHDQAIQTLIENLSAVTGVLSEQGEKFSGSIDRLEKLVTGLAADRDPIGEAIESLSTGTASLAGLLTSARPPLAETVTQLNRLAPLLNDDKDKVDVALQHAPENYRKLVRLGAYGSFIQYYICGLTLRVTDLQGRTAVFPWFKQETGRCAEP
ncbi:MCE family protein [Mycobacterium aquaticum]|uniref:Mammalian cell entry protein n=1 Tax=Mycobacterium aquaticum TaxID=1927124 RepID=A0A1X0AWV8_9MYCO|nr:MCE family protein [Mycobacterium aquaticum]ORA34489.1 mammalian cell entry protein [Mycobacterium aquaticum]